MPYIKKERRKELDEIVTAMSGIEIVEGFHCWYYVLYRYAELFLKPSYNVYKNYLGEITESVEEMMRRNDMFIIDIGEEVWPMASKGSERKLNEVTNHLSNILKADGDLNYILYAYSVRACTSKTRSKFVVQLRSIVKSIRRRILAPYEDEKIRENGDIK